MWSDGSLIVNGGEVNIGVIARNVNLEANGGTVTDFTGKKIFPKTPLPKPEVTPKTEPVAENDPITYSYDSGNGYVLDYQVAGSTIIPDKNQPLSTLIGRLGTEAYSGTTNLNNKKANKIEKLTVSSGSHVLTEYSPDPSLPTLGSGDPNDYIIEIAGGELTIDFSEFCGSIVVKKGGKLIVGENTDPDNLAIENQGGTIEFAADKQKAAEKIDGGISWEKAVYISSIENASDKGGYYISLSFTTSAISSARI